MALYGFMWLVWPYVALKGIMWHRMVLLLCTAMVMCGLIRLSMDLCDLVWSCMAFYGLVIVLYRILWSFMAEYRLFSRS